MRIVAVDTSLRGRVVAVGITLPDRDGGVAGPQRAAPTDSRAVEDVRVDACLPALLGELAAGGADAVVAVVGPGSYAGVRAGMAAALGLARALDLPLHGAGALEVVALAAVAAGHAAPGATVAAVAHAGRGGLDVARYRVEPGSAPAVSELEAPVHTSVAAWSPAAGDIAVTPREYASRRAEVLVLGAAAAARGLVAAAVAAVAGPPLAAAGLEARAAAPAAAASRTRGPQGRVPEA